MSQPESIDDQTILTSLHRAVADALNRKRRLGQYAVVSENGVIRRIQPSAESPSIAVREESVEYNAPGKTEERSGPNRIRHATK